MILESLLAGPEYQLEMMLSGGRVIFHCLSSHYSHARDALVFPAAASADRRAALLDAASRTATALGLNEGVVHVELFDDPSEGAVVIEVNNRLSRGFLPMKFAHQVRCCVHSRLGHAARAESSSPVHRPSVHLPPPLCPPPTAPPPTCQVQCPPTGTSPASHPEETG